MNEQHKLNAAWIAYLAAREEADTVRAQAQAIEDAAWTKYSRARGKFPRGPERDAAVREVARAAADERVSWLRNQQYEWADETPVS